jgi:cytochrome c peroxidase
MFKRLVNLWVVACALAIIGSVAGERRTLAHSDNTTSLAAVDASGVVLTVNTNGSLDLNNPFFQPLGTNGRSCSTCHRPAQGWTITPQSVTTRFEESDGLDPIFRTNDGSNCEGADVSSLAKRKAAFSMLLNKGLIRVGIDVPSTSNGGEFVIESVDDPYHCNAPLTAASMFRRPLPSTNLRFLSAVMWDGRESSATTSTLQDLAHQANDATLGHAQASVDLTTQEAADIVAFETGLFTAQAFDFNAGSLQSAGALGGPAALSQQPFFIGVNDPVGLNPTGALFDPRAFTIFTAWTTPRHDDLYRARTAIARGEELFNMKTITITGVGGLNNQTFSNGVTLPSSFSGTCTTCHDTPNVGDHSVKAPLNLGLTDASRRTPDMPLYTLRRLSTGETVQTTDPGRAMLTGKWADVGKFKGPILRGLASRAPYFHNGLAASLEEVVDFYDTRFGIGLTAGEKADLVAFLRSL